MPRRKYLHGCKYARNLVDSSTVERAMSISPSMGCVSLSRCNSLGSMGESVLRGVEKPRLDTPGPWQYSCARTTSTLMAGASRVVLWS
jgi:hypothetical protein